MMPKDLKDLLRAFNDHGVKYLIVGDMPSASMQNREQRKTWISLSNRMQKIVNNTVHLLAA